MLSAETQKSIVSFLQGQSVERKNTIDPINLRAEIGLRGEIFGRSFQQNAESLSRTGEIELLKKLKVNGFPDRCMACPMFFKEFSTYMNPHHGAIVMREMMRCRNGGCNEGKNQFIENLSNSEISMIELEVERKVTKFDVEPSYAPFGGLEARARTSSEIKLEAYNKDDPIFLAKRREKVEKAKREIMELQLAFRKEQERAAREKAERELAELIEIENSKPDSDFYGVEVW